MERITNELKDKLLSTRTGYTRAEIESLGFIWPPHKGWKRIALKRLELEAEYVYRIKAGKQKRKAERKKNNTKAPIKYAGESGLTNGFVVRRTGTGRAHIFVNGRTLCRRGKTDRTVVVSKAPDTPICSTCTNLQKTDPNNDRYTEAQNKDFYSSWEWKKLRFEALKMYGAECMCCKSDHRVVVDHIKPRSRFPDLELDISNLQILCNDCNMGKSNDDYTDFRPGKADILTPDEYAELEQITDTEHLH